MANETELTYLMILIGLIVVIHLILAHTASSRRDEKILRSAAGSSKSSDYDAVTRQAEDRLVADRPTADRYQLA